MSFDQWLARWWVRRSSAILGVVFLVTLGAGALLPRLTLETDLAALLPGDSRAADAYRLFIDRFGGFEKVFVLVQDPGFEGSEDERIDHLIEAADLLAAELATRSEVAQARSGIETEEERFVLERVVRRSPLLYDVEELGHLEQRLEPGAIRERVARLRSVLASPAGALERTLAPYDPLGLADGLGLMGGRGSLPVDPLSGAFLSPSGDASLVVLTPASSEIDPEAGRRLLAELDTAFRTVETELGADPPDGATSTLDFTAVGGPLYAAHDERLLRGDLERTLGGSLLACALVLVLAFGGLSIPTAAIVVVLLALVWTGAGLALSVGGVAAVSLGFAAVLVGLGIDYGIHAGVRFAEARREGAAIEPALAGTVRHAGSAIATSAATTAVAFLALALAHFRPLREVGLMVAVGIGAIFLAAATAGGALLARLGGRGRAPGPLWRVLGWPALHLPKVGRRYPGWVLAVVVVLSGVAAVGVGRLELDADPRSLRPTDHPLLAAEELLAKTFGLGSDTATVLIWGEDLDSALARTAAVARILRSAESSGPGSAITVTAASDLLGPGANSERLARLAELPFAAAAATLEGALRDHNLDPAGFAPGLSALRALGEGRDPADDAGPDTGEPSSWPSSVAELVRLDDDGVWSALRVRLAEGTWSGGPPAELVARLETAAPGVEIASAMALGREMRDLARSDVTRLATAALAAIVLILALAFGGRPARIVLALVPVSLGALWTCGLLGLMGGRLDLVGLAVVPILLGIGIDDGLHALHGAAALRSDKNLAPFGEGSRAASDKNLAPLAAAVTGAGRAMALTTLTTAVGFGSLVLSRVPGLRQGGWLVAFGVLVCLVVTLMVLPAVEALALPRRGR